MGTIMIVELSAFILTVPLTFFVLVFATVWRDKW